jgi:hypothetical protein
MVRVAAVVHSHRVVEEREEEDNLDIGTIGHAGEREAVLTHTLPVSEAVQGRGV